MLKCMCEIKGITACFLDTLIEHSSSKNNFYSIVVHTGKHNGKHEEHNNEDFGKFQETI